MFYAIFVMKATFSLESTGQLYLVLAEGLCRDVVNKLV